MLCGYPPFIGRSEEAILDKISFGYINLNGNEWKSVSNEAKIFLKKLLTYDPKERISASTALKDSWLQSLTKSNAIPKSMIVQIVKNFNVF
jgi:calcium-dependent protein kinase